MSIKTEEAITRDTAIMAEGKEGEPMDADELRLAQMGT